MKSIEALEDRQPPAAPEPEAGLSWPLPERLRWMTCLLRRPTAFQMRLPGAVRSGGKARSVSCEQTGRLSDMLGLYMPPAQKPPAVEDGQMQELLAANESMQDRLEKMEQ